MTTLPSNRAAGLALFAFLAAATALYIYLVSAFGYDDILREPAGVILDRFAAGGAVLPLAWFCFACATLFFIAPALLVNRWLEQRTGRNHRLTLVFGIASALLQSAGLARWAFVTPVLANMHGAADSSEAVRAAAEVALAVINAYGGVVVGEFLGQMTLVAWTAGVGLALLRLGGFYAAAGTIGLATIPFWIAGQSELIHSAIPAFPMIEATPIAFMAWQVFLLLLAAALISSRPIAAGSANAGDLSPPFGYRTKHESSR